jgi:alkylhydroperoxidase family enzyme
MRVAAVGPQDQPFPDLSPYAPGLIAAAGNFAAAAYIHSKLPLRLFEAARTATAVINGCTVCMNWRAARDVQYLGLAGGVTALGPEPDEAFYQAVLAGDYSKLTAKERLGVEFVQRTGEDPKGLAEDDAFWARMRKEFTDAEIVDLAYCNAAWMGLGRLTHVLGVDVACAIPTHRLAAVA